MKYDYMRNTTNSNINPLSLAIPSAIENGGACQRKKTKHTIIQRKTRLQLVTHSNATRLYLHNTTTSVRPEVRETFSKTCVRGCLIKIVEYNVLSCAHSEILNGKCLVCFPVCSPRLIFRPGGKLGANHDSKCKGKLEISFGREFNLIEGESE